jgi:hypothetical protein
MTWFAFQNGHADIEAAGVEEKLLVSYGFHGYATKQQADRNPNRVNPIQGVALDNWDVVHAERKGVSDVSGGVNAIGDLAHRLTESQTWIRVGEFAAGGILLILGANAILRGTAVGSATQSATRTARKAGQAVIPRP